ncbi:MAG: hypothetical protein QM761_11860 [Pseudoxanthomonas sp.]
MSRDKRSPPANANAAALRTAGLRVTSARLAALRLAPALLQRHGRLDARLLHDACLRHGYAVSKTSFYNVLSTLATAGLLPAGAIASTSSRVDDE